MSPLFAQEVSVRIHITDDSLRPVPAAVITLSTGNERLIRDTSDALGAVTLRLRKAATYVVDIVASGWASYTGSLFADSSHPAVTYKLHKSRDLQGAIVTATQPMMRQEGDMTIIDPEQLAAASTSSYEILEKTPGVVADQDGNFYMTSSTPAAIYINGREMKMSAADVAAMLKSVPPNSIQRIEIMRTPSARYDASGGGGIINIVLKKGVKLGLTGSVNAGVQQGVYSNQTAGLNLSYGDGGVSSYLNVNLARRQSLEHISSTRILSADSLLSQDANTVYDGRNIYLGYGVAKTVGGKWDLSYDGRVSGNSNDNLSDNESIISAKSSGVAASDNLTGIRNTGATWTINQSIDAKYRIDTSGSEWTLAATWNGVFGDNGQDIHSRFASAPGNEVTNNGDIATQRHYFMLQTDLKYQLRRKLSLEGGVKSAVSPFRHESDYEIMYAGASYTDPLRSTTYRYSEAIHAAYAQATKQWGNLILKGGLRAEYTGMDGTQTRPGDTSFSIHRTDLFPYVYLSKPIVKMLGFELRAYLVYRKTIQRPAYDYLNPFQRFVDQYLYEAGNPALRPQFTYNYEFNISADEHPVIVVGYNDVKDVFANVVYESELNKNIALRTWDNLGASKELYVRGLGGVPPGGKYFGIVGGQYNLNMYDGYYNGAPLQYRRESFTFFTYHNLKLGRKTNIVVNGFARLKGILQFYELGTFGALNASVSRHFLDKKLTLTAAVQDIFYTNRYNATIDQSGISGAISRYNDSRRFGINLRYNFGVRKREEKKSFLNGTDAEKGNEE